MTPPAFKLPPAGQGGRSVTQQALEAQTALLPYALGVFALCLPIFVWVGSFADHSGWMTLSFAIFGIAWGAFYAAINWMKTAGPDQLARRGRIHIACALLWAGAIVQITAMAETAGPAREALLMLALGAAVICTFFTAPWLPSLLIVAPAAAAAPLLALSRSPEGLAYNSAMGAVALSMALALVLNRQMRHLFALGAERETLIFERARSQEEAERLARSKSDLVATLSHEIRNGLTGVAYVLSAASGRSARAAPSRDQLSAALDATNDLVAVLNTTLDSETAEAGRLSVETVAFDPVPLVEDLVLLNRPQAAAKGLEMTLHVAPELAGVEGGGVFADAVRTRQILSNLIANALKYTVRGRVEVRVEMAGPDQLAIEVADTGPGLTADEMVQAFEPFARVIRTGVGVPGAGLGLSLSRQLARLMGGDVVGQGAVGVGSCFRLQLPYDGAALLGVGRLDEAPGALAPSGRGLRILVAETDSLSAAMLRTVLEQLGHQVVHAHDGVRAAELSQVCDFDLATVDSRIVEPGAPAVIRNLRALTRPSRTPLAVIAVIDGDLDEARDCVEAGADAVLRRPVGVASVARAVAEAVRGEPASARRAVA